MSKLIGILCVLALAANFGCHEADRDHEPSTPSSAASIPSSTLVIPTTDAATTSIDAGSASDRIHEIARPGGAATLRWQVRAMPSASTQVVVLSYDGAAQTLAMLDAEIALVDISNAPLLLASGKIQPDSEACDEPESAEGTASNFELDLAPYRITEHERAIGVRLACHQTFGAGEASRKELVLFARDPANAKSLHEIFRTSAEDHEEQRGPGDLIDDTTTVSVQPQMTAQHFDLSVRTTTVISSLDSASTRPASTHVKTTRFVWDGSHYVVAKNTGKSSK